MIHLHDIINLAMNERLHPQPASPGSAEMLPIEVYFHLAGPCDLLDLYRIDRLSVGRDFRGRPFVVLHNAPAEPAEPEPEPVPTKVAGQREPPVPGSEGTP